MINLVQDDLVRLSLVIHSNLNYQIGHLVINSSSRDTCGCRNSENGEHREDEVENSVFEDSFQGKYRQINKLKYVQANQRQDVKIELTLVVATKH